MMINIFGKFRIRIPIKLLIILVIVVGVSGYFGKRYFFPSTDGLEVSEIKQGRVEEVYILTGVVNADEYAQMTFPTAGKISWVGAAEGEVVKKGQYLARLDTTNLNSTFESAKSDLRIADAEAQRVLDDVKDNDSDESFTEKDTRTLAEANKDQAYEALKQAEYNLKNSILIAPFSGIVTSVANPFAGVNVLATQTQIELINPETIYFEVAADQSEVTTLKVGDKLRIELDADSDKRIEGEIEHISYAPEPGEVGIVYAVRIKFTDLGNDDLILRVGMTGDAVFVQEEKTDVLYAPSDFLKSDEDGDYLLTNNGRDKIYVEIGLEGEERVEVSGEGLTQGLLIYD